MSGLCENVCEKDGESQMTLSLRNERLLVSGHQKKKSKTTMREQKSHRHDTRKRHAGPQLCPRSLAIESSVIARHVRPPSFLRNLNCKQQALTKKKNTTFMSFQQMLNDKQWEFLSFSFEGRLPLCSIMIATDNRTQEEQVEGGRCNQLQFKRRKQNFKKETQRLHCTSLQTIQNCRARHAHIYSRKYCIDAFRETLCNQGHVMAKRCSSYELWFSAQCVINNAGRVNALLFVLLQQQLSSCGWYNRFDAPV